MGYDGVRQAVELGKRPDCEDKTIDTGVVLVDSKNVDSDEVQGIIHP